MCPKLKYNAVWPFGEADQNHTLDEIRILRHQPFPDPTQDGRMAAILAPKIA